MESENITETMDSTIPDETKRLSAVEGKKQQRSSIAFPYMDLDEAFALAGAIHRNVGTGECSADQLAAWIKQSPASSAFRLRLSTSRLFGVIEFERPDAIRLSEIGRLIVDTKREREARARAFLTVPLYMAVFEKFKSGVIPPTAALERELVALGVASTLKERARTVLERSAEQAGFFEHGRDRLVMPGFVAAPSHNKETKADVLPETPSGGGSGRGGTPGLDLDPLLLALLQKIPSKEEGWPAAKRVRWFKAFAMNVSQVFDEDQDEPVELKIEVSEDSSQR
jgi:hypothetical protein